MGHAAHGSMAQLGIGDAARQNLDALPPQQLHVGLLLRTVGQPQHHDLRAPPAALLREVRADESRPARHQQSHPKRSPIAATIRSLACPSP